MASDSRWNFPSKCEQIPGELGRYYVRSDVDNRAQYLVDLFEYDCNGRCNCVHFETRCWPLIRDGECSNKTICKHIAICFRQFARMALQMAKKQSAIRQNEIRKIEAGKSPVGRNVVGNKTARTWPREIQAKVEGQKVIVKQVHKEGGAMEGGKALRYLRVR
jgi:hypothetical protein